MQNIATKVFTYSSIAFGVVGVLMIAALSERGVASDVRIFFTQTLMALVFVILSSFAVMVAHLSLYAVHVAHKYLHEK